MLIESKIKIGYDSMFNVPQAYFKSAHLLNKMALVQFQCSRTVVTSDVALLAMAAFKIATTIYKEEMGPLGLVTGHFKL